MPRKMMAPPGRRRRRRTPSPVLLHTANNVRPSQPRLPPKTHHQQTRHPRPAGRQQQQAGGIWGEDQNGIEAGAQFWRGSKMRILVLQVVGWLI